MGKHRKGGSKSGGGNRRSNATTATTSGANNNASSTAPTPTSQKIRSNTSSNQHRPNQTISSTSSPSNGLSISEWLFFDRRATFLFLACMFFGSMTGFMFGAGRFVSGMEWRRGLTRTIRSSIIYQIVTVRGPIWDYWLDGALDWVARVERDLEAEEYAKDPTHPRPFAVLREAVIREKGGYVHPDLGILHPAPSGAIRGIGMVRDGHYKCQSKCFPGSEEERRKLAASKDPPILPRDEKYRQEDVLIRVPLSFQMTRQKAVEILQTVIPQEAQRKAGFHDLDDAAILVLYLAHERGVGKYSRWLPYITSLPMVPSCGYSKHLRSHMLKAIQVYRNELGVDTESWEEELMKATHYGQRIAEGLNADYGSSLRHPADTTELENIEWALCQVASRATAGNEKYGSLRLVPVVDLINHDANAGGFVELTGTERVEDGDFLDATEDDSGTFVVRSLRHGRKKPLRKGQELLANYNVPHYAPLDWFVSLGFVPEERWSPWQKIDPVLPQIRQEGPFKDEESMPTEQIWKEKEAQILQHLKNSEL